jgi:hypothetical protein
MKTTAWFAVLAALFLGGVPGSQAEAKTSATLTNNSSYAIYELYLSPSHESRWGPDQLGKHVLESGMSYTLVGMPCGDYDIKLVDEDGDECEILETYLCGDAGDWTLTDEELLSCQGFETNTSSATLYNQSRWDIHRLFISPTHESHWGPDQLGKYVLESGASFTLTGIACGNYDVKLVDEDGEECVVPEVSICGEEQAVVTNDDLLDCEGY